MTLWLIAYSRRGSETAEKITAAMEALGYACRSFAREEHRSSEQVESLAVSASAWAEKGFREADALVFCCAAGIAVRAIAPHVRSKTTDPAVVVVDELGRFAIPILSGHLGGANLLAEDIGRAIGALPVVTTATDLNGLFAVDVFAKKNHLHISSMKLAKEVSAALLRGEKVGFKSDFPCKGELPVELTETEDATLGIYVTEDESASPFVHTLRLMPRRFAVGLGCRRDKDPQAVERFFLERLAALGLTPKNVRCIASIDVKKDEPALLALAQKYGLPFNTYTAQELNALEGEFSHSAFVHQTVGVDSVCERAAVMAAGGALIQKKTAEEGMTFALARYEEELSFE